MNKLGLTMIVLVGAACGGDSGGSGPISTANAMDVCETICQHEVECTPDSQTLDACIADCTGDLGGGGYRTDAANDIADCIAGLACTADEDACLTECSPTSAHESFETRCRAKVAECADAGADADAACETTPSTGDDDVGFFCLFTPAVMEALSACFDEPCTGIETCFSNVTTQFNL